VSADVYATVSEFWAQTGRQHVYVRPRQRLASADAAANTLTLEGHGLADGDPVQFVADTGGVLPAPLAAGTQYYALPVTGSSSLFQVAASAGGAAVNLSTAGTGNFSVTRSVVPMIERYLEIASRTVDRKSRGHAVPQSEPYPVEVVNWTIRIAEWHVAGELGKLGGQNDDPIWGRYIDALRDLADLSKGASMRDAAASPPVNLAIRGTNAGSDPRGWAPLGSGVIR